MKRSEAHYVLTKLIKSGIIKRDYVYRLAELRTLICTGREKERETPILRFLWVLMAENWLDETMKENLGKLVQSMHDGFENCGSGISVRCNDCPYNDHFSWGD